MRLFAIACWLAVAAAMAVAADAPDVPAGTTARFPPLKAANLESREFNLPTDFGGERNLLLVAFQREQQKEVDTWLTEMKRFEELDPGFHYYELPTIARLNPMARWFIDTGMRRGIPDKKARERTITLYTDKKAFTAALQLPTENTIYALLVDRSGKVLWRAEGTFDETKALSLKQALTGK